MKRFKIEFERTWTVVDMFSRVIEAVNLKHARELAAAMACEADHDCPDDMVSTNVGEAGEWQAVSATKTTEPADEPPFEPDTRIVWEDA